MRSKALLAICLISLQGCTVLGASAIGNRSSSIMNPNVSKDKRCIERRRGSEGVSPVTSEELLVYWGKPDDISKDEFDNEIWRYEYGVRWNGLLIGLIIPIPLFIPVGHDYIEFSIYNYDVISAFMKDDSGENGFMLFEYHFGIRPVGKDDKIQVEKYNTIGYQEDVILEKFLCVGDYTLIR